MWPIVNVPEEDRATDTGNRQKIGVKIARVVPEISSLTDRQTHRQTFSSHYLATMLELLTDAALRTEQCSCGD